MSPAPSSPAAVPVQHRQGIRIRSLAVDLLPPGQRGIQAQAPESGRTPSGRRDRHTRNGGPEGSRRDRSAAPIRASCRARPSPAAAQESVGRADGPVSLGRASRPREHRRHHGRHRQSRGPHTRRHWRVPEVMPQRLFIYADNVFPSHASPLRPVCAVRHRRAASTACSCCSLNRRGRPDRSCSAMPASPYCSKRRFRQAAVRGASPSNCATWRPLIPWATSSTPCRR